MFFFCVKSGIFRGFTPYRTPYRILWGIFRGYLVGDFLKIGLHSVRALLFHFLRNMAVHIKGEAGRGVAEVLLDGLYIVPLLKGYDGVGVAQIMEAGIGSAHLFGGLLEPFESGLGHDIPPVRVGEHQPEGVFPSRPHEIAGAVLLLLYPFQNIHDKRRDGQLPPFIVFGGRYVVLAAFFLFPHELLLDRDRVACEVYGFPRQTADLTLPHTREHGNGEQIAERFALLDHRQKGGQLCLFERLDLLFLHAGKGARVGGVHADITELQRLIKGFVEDPVDVLDGFRGKVHFALEAVIERLYLGSIEGNQLDFSEGGDYVGTGSALIGGEGERFCLGLHIFVKPHFKPLFKGDPFRLKVRAIIGGLLRRSHGLQSLRLFLPVEAHPLPVDGASGFPCAVFALTDGAVAFCVTILHLYRLSQWLFLLFLLRFP